MNSLSSDAWTVVAHRRHGAEWWDWSGGHAFKPTMEASGADTIVLMQRRTDTGFALVARLAGPRWRRFRQRVKEGRFHWPQRNARSHGNHGLNLP